MVTFKNFRSILTLNALRLFILLLTLVFSLTVSAQKKPVLIDGYWKGQGYELYLQKGLFLLQTQEKVSLSGTYKLEKGYLTLKQGTDKQAFAVKQEGNFLVLLGAETEIKLKADKNCAPRDIYLGMISEIQMSHLQEASSSQLPDQYHN